ncbi:MAG: protein kinase [Pseudomonadales bacterium]
MKIDDVVDQYRITERLGGGGMGEVFRAQDLELDRSVAIKCMRPELADFEEAAQRFRSEARTLAKLSHPNIAAVYRFFDYEQQLVMVMEFIDGRSFSDLMSEGSLNPPRIVDLVGQALDGLAYAHEHGVVHRDIKPPNLMVNRQGVVKVVDFGIARLIDGTRMTRTGSSIGTPVYMAPEQVLGKPVDARTDLYSLGIVLYEMLSGELPFDGDSDFEVMRAHLDQEPRPIDAVARDTPVALRQCVSRAMTRDSDARFQSATEFALALRRALDHPASEDSATYARPSLTDPPAPRGNRNGRWVAGALAALVAVAAAGGIWQYARQTAEPEPVMEAGAETTDAAGAETAGTGATSVLPSAETLADVSGSGGSETAGDQAPPAQDAGPTDGGGAEPPDRAETQIARGPAALPAAAAALLPEPAQASPVPAVDTGPPVVAVLPFRSSRPTPQAESLTRAVNGKLVNSGEFRVVERSRLDSLLGELEFQRSAGFVTPENAVSTGQTLGARILVTGDILDFGSERQTYEGYNISTTRTTHRLQAQISAVDVATGTTLYSGTDDVSVESQTVQGSRSDSSDRQLASQLADKLVRGLLASSNVRALVEPAKAVALEVIAEPANADVEIDGTYYGSAGGAFQVAPGFHVITVSSAGFLDWSKRVLVRPGSRVVARLEPDNTERTEITVK